MATQVQPRQAEVQERQSLMAEALRGIKPISEGLGPFKAVFYAKNKVGKTQLGGSSGLKTLIISTEPAGTETLVARGLKNVDYLQINSWSEMEGPFWYLHAGDHDYEIVVIDTWSMATTQCLRYVMGQETRLDPLMPKGDHWQKLAQIMNNEVLRWVNLPMHVVFLCQERNNTVKDENGDDTLQMIGPATSPAVQSVLMGAVGTIGHMYIKEVEENGKTVLQRRMHLAPKGVYMAGTRVRGLPPIMANPTLAAILDIRAKTGELPPDQDLILTATAVDEDEEVTPQQTPVSEADLLTL